MNGWAFLGILGLGVALGVIVGDIGREPGIDAAQAEFERSDARWDWQGWRDRGELKCVDQVTEIGEFNERRVLLRSCHVHTPRMANPVAGTDPGFVLRVFVCTPSTCDWVLR